MAAQMPGDKGAADKADETSDTEGHNLMIDPNASRDLARVRAKDVEREARQRQRQKEARGR